MFITYFFSMVVAPIVLTVMLPFYPFIVLFNELGL